MNDRRLRDRRDALVLGGAIGVGLVAAACGGQGRGAESPQAHGGEEISPAEDLMCEHGVLNRVLLIYEEGIRRLDAPGEKVPVDQFAATASIVRRFIEDYHGKLEEDFLFPRFEKAGKMTDLVATLRKQHAVGRKLTDDLLRLMAPRVELSADARKQVTGNLRSFIRMYRPHEAREDTVLFPALRTVIPPKELEELGERFEEKEHALFGKEGFEGIVAQVAAIEARLGIGDLASFTPS